MPWLKPMRCWHVFLDNQWIVDWLLFLRLVVVVRDFSGPKQVPTFFFFVCNQLQEACSS